MSDSETREQSGLSAALEAALAGGPERHHAKITEQGKLPVRERVARLVDPAGDEGAKTRAGFQQVEQRPARGDDLLEIVE